MLRVIIFLTLISIVGCGPLTVRDLRDISPETFSFEVEGNYQAVYRKVLEPVRKKYGYGGQIQGDLYSDIKTGTITVGMRPDATWMFPGIAGLFLGVDIKAISENRSLVTLYYAGRSKKAALEVKEWIAPNAILTITKNKQIPDGN